MPQTAADDGVELLELRVLDGPNRFFNRPAVKLEFAGPEIGAAAAAAHEAGEMVRHFHAGLDLPRPRLKMRESADRLRAAVAWPWHRRTIAQAVGTAAARVVLGGSSPRRELRGLRAVALGPLPHLPVARVPIIAITGTNGKSTTTRLVAHIATHAGLRVGMTNSDGIYVRGELVEAGDWTGFGGASRVLAEPGLQLAVLETARGGVLLRGIGYAANDIGVVTNVSADHLGLQGIDTLDELAEVKGAIVRITRRSGWAVLNADDERVWAMRSSTRAGWYAFTLDPRSPAVAEALARGGRAAVVRDGAMVLLRANGPARRLASVDEVPVTFGGVSDYNLANALAAAAAADGVGIGSRRIAAGLRSFTLDAGTNPGRLNLYERGGVLVLIDFAHNEAGLRGLIVVARRLVDQGKLRIAIGTAGDRTDEILRNLGQLAGRGADDVVICEKRHYLRGRELAEMNALLRAGVADGGYRGKVREYPTELASLQALVKRSESGDVVACMTHVERAEIGDWLRDAGFVPVTAELLRERLAAAAASASG
jgi:cyanophycin synthetase